MGRSPLRSKPAQTQRPSVIAKAAGPSHGSITELQYEYMSIQGFGKSTACLDQLSGTNIVFAIGAFRPARTSISKTESKAAESDDPLAIMGLISSAISPKASDDMRISWLFIQLVLPFSVLISPL